MPKKLRGQLDLEGLQDEVLKRGCFLYANVVEPSGASESLRLLPSTDPFDAIAVEQTNGANCGIGPGYVVEWMRRLAETYPYRLTTVAGDTLAGRFLQPIADPLGLAEQMAAFCPDIVHQGVGDVESLAEHIEASGRFFFWWD